MLVPSYRGWLTRVTQSTALAFSRLKFHHTFQYLQMGLRKTWNLPTLIYGKRVFEDIAPHVGHLQNIPPNQRDLKAHSATESDRDLSQSGVIHLGSHRVHRNSG